ncbi:DNA-directed RNA polymerase I subunit RPA34 [Eublepharis macularius]|uniref:DNA-directed RNA polymerase I subunit RPA34 n=1 Tax=Eublepharis macularius TaxID=481883 RepID=A0AA97KGJ7_EUBMA|nr:DNA-directed RNA polymerase I subunit RPA34 [Eublepharis macularius]
MEAPEGPRRFKPPPDLAAAPFCPGPPFVEETLRGPSKQLWLIRAPAAFGPESLDGHIVPLRGLQTLKAVQLDGTQKVFSIQRTLENLNCAHLLAPSGRVDQLTCCPPFSGSLSICERYGDPGGHQPLFPVAARPTPQIPAGLKQRFLPFGSHPRRAPLPEATEEPPRKKKKKKKKGSEELPPPLFGTPLGEATGAGEAECQHAEEGAAWWAISHPAEAQPCPTAFAKGSLLAGKVEEPSPRSKKKKKRKEDGEVPQEAGGEAEGLQEPGSSNHQPWLEGNSDPGVGERSLPGTEEAAQDTRKGKKKGKDVTSNLVIKEEVAEVLWDFSGLVATPESELVLAMEGPGVGSSAYKAKKKKEKKKEKPEETAQELEGWPAQQEPGVIKQELGGWAQLCTPPEAGGGQEAEPGLEGLSRRHKKKKHHHRREAAEEGLAWPKQEQGNS